VCLCWTTAGLTGSSPARMAGLDPTLEKKGLRPGYINKKRVFFVFFKYKILRIYVLAPESGIPIFTNARVGNIHR